MQLSEKRIMELARSIAGNEPWSIGCVKFARLLEEEIARAQAETQRLDALHYLRMGRENLRLGNRVHNLDFDKAERILAQPTSDAKRAEELRHALSVARDQMRVMANWVKFSDPAAYSWSCNAITIVNAVLERGEPQ